MARSAVKFEISAIDKTKNAFDSATRGISGLESRFMSLMGPITALASVAGLGTLITKTAIAGDAFDDMSARTGVTVEELSGLSHVAKLTGTDIDAMEKSLKYLTGQMLDVTRGMGEGKKTFDELGISALDSNGRMRGTTDVLMDVAGKIALIDDETRQAAYAMEIFGSRSGSQLVPMLRMGKEGIAGLIDEAKRLGITWTTEDATAAGAFNDSLESLKGAAGGLGRSIATELFPELIKGAKGMNDWIAANKGWVKEEIGDKIGDIKENIQAINQYKDVIGGAIGVTLIATHIGAVTKLSTALWGVAAVLEYMKNLGGKEPIQMRFIDRMAGMTFEGFGGGAFAGGKGASGDFGDLKLKLPVDEKSMGDADRVMQKYQDMKNVFASPYLIPKSNIGARFMSIEMETPRLGSWLDQYDTLEQIDGELLALRGRNQESWIRLTTEGYEQQKALAAFYFEEEFGALAENDERKIVARGTLNNELEIMERDHLAQVRNDNLAAMMQFGSTWGSYMFSMMEQSGSAWDSIEAGFKRMLERMAVEATAAGIFNLITGGVGGGFTGGFKSYLSKAFGFREDGGDVQAGRAYVVGEKRPELFIPRTSGTILPNAAAAMKAATQQVTNKTRIQVIVQTNLPVSELDPYKFAELARKTYDLGLMDKMREMDGDA